MRLPILVVLLFLTTSVGAQDWRYPVRVDGGFGLIDEAGARQGTVLFDEVDAFQGPLGPARSGDRWGYVGLDGNWVIQPTYLSALRFSGGFASVEAEYGWILIDQAGLTVSRTSYSELGQVSEGVAPYRVDEKVGVGGTRSRWGLVNVQGFEVADAAYDGTAAISQGRWPVQVYRRFLVFRIERRWGFADIDGELVIPAAYNTVHPFSEGRARVSDGRAISYLSPSGDTLLSVPYLVAASYHDGLARISEDGRAFGFMNPEGEVVIETRFDAARDFSEGLAAVRVGRLWGYIDTSGAEVIPPAFSVASAFQGPLARVVHDGREVYLNRSGQAVWGGTQ